MKISGGLVIWGCGIWVALWVGISLALHLPLVLLTDPQLDRIITLTMHGWKALLDLPFVALCYVLLRRHPWLLLLTINPFWVVMEMFDRYWWPREVYVYYGLLALIHRALLARWGWPALGVLAAVYLPWVLTIVLYFHYGPIPPN